MKRYVLFSLLAAVCWMVGCGGGGGSTPPPTTVTLLSIQVTPSNPTLSLSKNPVTQQFKAAGSYSDGSTKDLTSTANWLSTNAAVATISVSGLATTAGSAGTTTITATSGTVSGSTVLTVANSLVSIAVTPANLTLAPPNQQSYTATGTYGDGTTQDITATVTWQSSDSTIAAINPSGLAVIIKPGTVNITATLGAISGSTSLTVSNPVVSVAVTPTNPSAAPGTKPQFIATGTNFDGTTSILTTQVTWSSSNTAVATISNALGLQGQATAVAAGTTTISATFMQNGVPVVGTTTLTVTNATITKIDVSPQSSPISLGSQQQYSALGTFSDGSQQDITNIVTWTSSDPTKVKIIASGLATGVAVTTIPVTITATYKGVSGTATVTVDTANLVSIAITPGSATLAQGTSRQFSATGTFNNGSTLNVTNQATWVSGNPAVATVGTHTGLVKAAATVQAPTAVTITVTLGAISQQVTVNVTNATPTAITVTPIAATIPAGVLQLFSATGTFSDGTTQDITQDSTWSSSDTTVATVSSPGRLLGKNAGTATVTAAFGAAPPGTAQLTVSTAILQSIAINPVQTILTPGSTATFAAKGSYSDGTMQSLSGVTWNTSNASVVSITGAGLATGLQAGSATITATYQSITSNNASVIVTPSPLTSIAISTSTPTIPEGVNAQFTAIGTFADQSTQNLTSAVSWASSQPSVATISNAFVREGLATGVGPGTTNITAVFGSVASNSATLTVTNATLKSIAITPSNPTVTHGNPVNFTAKGTFSDGSVIDLTTQASWTSSNATVATINNIGQASTVSAGTTTITATFVQKGVTTQGTTTLTVN